MKKLLSLSLLIAVSQLANAQAPINATVYDCDTISRNIYDVLGTGKSVIIMSKGVDCSICKNVAAGWQTWAANNKSDVEVWAAMTYLYNPNAFSASCVATNKWVSDYGWTDIFAFPDSSRDWFKTGTPRYYVYSAIDSSISYQGGTAGRAQFMALAQSIGLNDIFKSSSIKIAYSSDQVRLSLIPKSINRFRMIDMSGRIREAGIVNNENLIIESTIYRKGVYILQLLENNNPVGQTKIMIF